MKSIDVAELSVPKLHGYLLSAVAPRPIAFVSTIDENGNDNLAPFSFFNVFSANPPIAVFSPARRGRDNTTKHTYENVKIAPEVVINVVNYDMVHQTSLASSDYPKGVSEFEKAGFTALDSHEVKPKRVAESPFQMECRVKEVVELGTEGGAGNMVICEIVKIHIDENALTADDKIDPLKLDLVGRCGGNWYIRANEKSMFEVEKPLTTVGIGIDKLPEDVKNSTILTGNSLGQLGNVESLPNETDVNDYKLEEISELFINHENDALALEKALHEHAQQLLINGKVTEAWKTLLAFNN